MECTGKVRETRIRCAYVKVQDNNVIHHVFLYKLILNPLFILILSSRHNYLDLI